jgi:hypothetical protein
MLWSLTSIGPLALLSGYRTPAALRRLGSRRLTTWLRNRKTRSAEDLATAAVDAAARQHTRLPGEAAIAPVVRDLALELLGLHEKIHELDKLIEARFREHELAPVISSMPGASDRCWAPSSSLPPAGTCHDSLAQTPRRVLRCRARPPRFRQGER